MSFSLAIADISGNAQVRLNWRQSSADAIGLVGFLSVHMHLHLLGVDHGTYFETLKLLFHLCSQLTLLTMDSTVTDCGRAQSAYLLHWVSSCSHTGLLILVEIEEVDSCS